MKKFIIVLFCFFSSAVAMDMVIEENSFNEASDYLSFEIKENKKIKVIVERLEKAPYYRKLLNYGSMAFYLPAVLDLTCGGGITLPKVCIHALTSVAPHLIFKSLLSIEKKFNTIYQEKLIVDLKEKIRLDKLVKSKDSLNLYGKDFDKQVEFCRFSLMKLERLNKKDC